MKKFSLFSLVLTLTLLLVANNSHARGGKKGGGRSGGRSSSNNRSNSSGRNNSNKHNSNSHKHNNNSKNHNFNNRGSNNSSSGNNRFNRSGSGTRNNNGNNRNFNNKNYNNKYFGGNNNRNNNVNKSWSNNKHHDHHHNSWHHGHWNDHHHHHPAAVGVGLWGAWSVGTRIYNSGYYSYSNPYYVESTVVQEVPAVNYSVPIDPSLTSENPGSAPNESGGGMNEFDIAISEFKNGNYPKALELANNALKAIPNDPAIHEFRALVLFSMGNYTESASAIYSLLSVGPGWDWKTMSSLYSATAVYTQQLRSLENYCRENKKDPASRFLLAYHYITCGHIDYAVKELRVVLTITPDDQLAKKLIATFEPEKEAPQNDKPPAPQAVGESSLGSAGSKPSIKKEAIIGSWSSDRGTQGKITLTLNPDGNYVWEYKNQNVSDSFKGTYTMGGSILTLVDSKGNPMVANISQSAPNQFNFKLTASGANDPGLDFKK